MLASSFLQPQEQVFMETLSDDVFKVNQRPKNPVNVLLLYRDNITLIKHERTEGCDRSSVNNYSMWPIQVQSLGLKHKHKAFQQF